MTDVRYQQLTDFPRYAVTMDWLMTPANLIDDGPALQTAMIIALGTDARAADSDILPNPDSTDRRGWWGDMDAEEIWGGWPVGSKLWLLSRAKITGASSSEGATLARAEGYTRDAMRPFVTNRIASRVDVNAMQIGTGRIDVDLTMYRGPVSAVDLRYSELWSELGRG